MLNVESLRADVLQRVPAYRAFLNAHGCGEDCPFDQLPMTTKAGYLLAYPTEELCWDGTLANCHLIGCSSGFSKAGSIFWPKRPQDEAHYLEGVRDMLRSYYHIDSKRTLILVCLAFGTWIGGMQLAASMRTLAAQATDPVTVATPGLNLNEAAEIVARFQNHFEQVLWITNPSNISLIAALLTRHGVTPKPAAHNFAVVGEYYTETFREWVADKFGHPSDAPFCVWTGYGSADTGGLGVETEATIRARKWLNRNPERCQQLFGISSPPMLLQPSADALIEVHDGNLVVTKDQLIPLIRYDTRDAGGFMAGTELPGFDLPEQVLFVHGRASDAVIFYGTNLMLGELADCLLELPGELGYGGLFEVHPREQDGVTLLRFKVFVTGRPDPDAYQSAILNFLKSRSLEFATKYEALSASFGQSMITVELADAGELQGKIKHRFVVEDQ